ncbi:MAG: hypothetical protein CL526_01535 [Aequorivita sp.]|nr:hypothetical protein [Aequorivita sp.]|tara:strand:- start:8696 stop:9412 length:717 start_codon:yes stop_codon:yes gene_type:complete
MKFLYTFLFFIFAFTSCKNKDEKPLKNTNTTEISYQKDSIENLAIQNKIANAYGYQNWDNVSEISFTFNVEKGGKHHKRAWQWRPKTSEVAMISAQDTINYNRLKVDSLTLKTDAAFINDKYWLLTPFQLIWDKNLKFSTVTNVVAPISKDTLNKLTVLYPNEGGYTPGDAYDFFYDENYIIKEWNYRKANTATPSLTTTWEQNKTFNGLSIATVYKDSAETFKLYFTNISVITETKN